MPSNDDITEFFRAQISAETSKRMNSPEMLARKSERQRESWTPERRAKQSKMTREAWTPERRAKMDETARRRGKKSKNQP